MSISFNLPTRPFVVTKVPHQLASFHDHEGRLLCEENAPARLAASWRMDATSAHLICEWSLADEVASRANSRRISQ
jgi:hypothetical protein